MQSVIVCPWKGETFSTFPAYFPFKIPNSIQMFNLQISPRGRNNAAERINFYDVKPPVFQTFPHCLFVNFPSFLETWKMHFVYSQDFPGLCRNPGVFTSITRRLGNLGFLSVLELICPQRAEITAAPRWTWNPTPDRSVFPFSLKKSPADRMYTNASFNAKNSGCTYCKKTPTVSQFYRRTLNSPQTLSFTQTHIPFPKTQKD